jgi:hypothetical protein
MASALEPSSGVRCLSTLAASRSRHRSVSGATSHTASALSINRSRVPLARAIPGGQRHDVDAARQIVTGTCIGGRHNLVAPIRVEVRDECGPHR